MTPELVEENPKFSGRDFEQAQLRKIAKEKDAKIIVMYGRRRVGKTELLEQTFRTRNILKFEGVEKEPEAKQQQFVLRQLSIYADEPLLKQISINSWLDIFDLIYRYTKEGTWTIYFEEIQWLAEYKDAFISQLKTAWDNQFRRNPNIILILCGSSPAFMINKVLHSKALYNRSQHEFHLKPLPINDAKQLLNASRSNREVMNAYLTLGGIPEYLKRINESSSVFTGICEQSFLPNSYFSNEYERIFISSMIQNPYYKEIIGFLSQKRFATREELAKFLGIEASGRLSSYLEELELTGFIQKYAPYNLAENSKLIRYQISDAYLQFFFKFIQPELLDIQSGKYQQMPAMAIKMDDYQKWLGFAFERYCRSIHHDIARILGFSGIKYKAGTFYNRSTNKEDPNFQIDLIFDRSDHVVTVCEIKYLQIAVGTEVIEDFEKKLESFRKKTKKNIHKVLISAEGVNMALTNWHYFDVVLTLDDLMGRN